MDDIILEEVSEGKSSYKPHDTEEPGSESGDVSERDFEAKLIQLSP